MNKRKKINKFEPSEVWDYWIDLDTQLVYVVAYIKGQLVLGTRKLEDTKINDPK